MNKIVPGHRNVVITISYGNYVNGKGGTDKVIKAHQELFNENDISVLHLYSASSIGEKIKIHRKDIWRALVDGNDCGLYSTNEIINILSELCNEYNLLDIFIHHFKNINIDQLKTILKRFNSHIYFYIHDYFTICPVSGLINDKECFCGSEKLGRVKCKGCSLFNESLVERVEEIKTFFAEFEDRISFVAPSDVAKNVWGEVYPQYLDKVTVIYHQKLVGSYLNNKEIIKDDQPLKVAFVGYQRPLKGWNIWYDAVSKIHNDVNYKFYQFGTTGIHEDWIKEVEVNFTKDLNSMITQLRKHNIDVAVLWSLLPETYSYTLYEAMAANAFILTNYKSGNIAYQVDRLKNGIVADSITDLKRILFDEKELRKKVNIFKNEVKCGPFELVENDELLSLVNGIHHSNCEYVKCSWCDRVCVLFYNVLLKIYKKLKRKKSICI